MTEVTLVGHTFGGGRFVVERHLQGVGLRKLFAGRETATGAGLLISYDKLPKWMTIEQFIATTSDAGSGVPDLVFAGPPDDFERLYCWGVLERARGIWLPSIIGQHPPGTYSDFHPQRLSSYDPTTALPNALALGVSVARILADEAERGHVLARFRPENIWVERGADGLLHATALSQRSEIMFEASYVDMVTWPVFDRYYYAPEVEDGNADERSLVFSLAIMVAEWATGLFPYVYKDHHAGPLKGDHTPLDLPRSLARLLSEGMRLEPKRRPTLSAFLERLCAERKSSGVPTSG
ncbi:MAG: hypothetical protein KIT31_02235 [Deltaproteobacteria bacterium]|nr:hypothetical protein [Deltaproteobacteria bacterium]